MHAEEDIPPAHLGKLYLPLGCTFLPHQCAQKGGLSDPIRSYQSDAGIFGNVDQSSEKISTAPYDFFLPSDGHNFRYAINVATSASSATAPDCHGNVTLTLCGRHVTGVTGLPATWDMTTVTISGAPIGTSYFTVRTDSTFNAVPIGWLLTTDDGRRYSGTTSGPTCGPNAVALAGVSAESDGKLSYVLVSFALGCLGCAALMLARVRISRK